MTSPMVEHAVELSERGYTIFPCRPRAKTPLTTHGFKDATRDECTIRHMWDRAPDANIAGACAATGISVLDIDTKAGADPREVIFELGLEGHTTVLTGEAPERSEAHPDSLSGNRGAQVFFRGDHRTGQTTIKGVELRGTGSYVVVPPSVHPSGVPYHGDLPSVNQLAEMPASWSASSTRDLRTVHLLQQPSGCQCCATASQHDTSSSPGSPDTSSGGTSTSTLPPNSFTSSTRSAASHPCHPPRWTGSSSRSATQNSGDAKDSNDERSRRPP